MTGIRHIWMLLAGCFFGVSCSLIDEDMSDCGKDYVLDYELRLVTNKTPTQLLFLST